MQNREMNIKYFVQIVADTISQDQRHQLYASIDNAIFHTGVCPICGEASIPVDRSGDPYVGKNEEEITYVGQHTQDCLMGYLVDTSIERICDVG